MFQLPTPLFVIGIRLSRDNWSTIQGKLAKKIM